MDKLRRSSINSAREEKILFPFRTMGRQRKLVFSQFLWASRVLIPLDFSIGFLKCNPRWRWLLSKSRKFQEAKYKLRSKIMISNKLFEKKSPAFFGIKLSARIVRPKSAKNCFCDAITFFEWASGRKEKEEKKNAPILLDERGGG